MLAIQRMPKIMMHVHLVVPWGRVNPGMAKEMDLTDFLVFVFFVKLADGAQLPYILVVTSMLRPDHVVKITIRTGQACVGFFKQAEGLLSRTAVVQIESHKTDTSLGRPRRNCFLDIAEILCPATIQP